MDHSFSYCRSQIKKNVTKVNIYLKLKQTNFFLFVKTSLFVYVPLKSLEHLQDLGYLEEISIIINHYSSQALQNVMIMDIDT